MTVLDLANEVRDAALRESQGDPNAHMRLLSSLQRLQNAAWTPMEKMTRLRVQLFHNVCVRLAQQHGIFQSLAASKQSTAEALSQGTGLDELAVARIMRILTAIGFADEIGPRSYQANETTHVCTRRGYVADIKYTTDIAMKVCSNVSKTIDKGIDTHAATMGKPYYAWLSEDDEHGPGFNEWMIERRNAAWEKWYQIYPMAEKVDLNASSRKEVFLVDVGGGLGFWTQELRREVKLPESERLIVQDQSHVVQGIEGIEAMAYDFFTPQPIKGARYYFFKQVIHNWSDAEALKILKNTAEAMDDESTCLINEHVLPEEKVSLRVAYWDVSMWILMSGIDRTESQWLRLLTEAGLQIIRIWYERGFFEELTEAVIECKKIRHT